MPVLSWIKVNKNVIGKASAIVALIVSLFALYNHIYDLGYSSATAEIQSQANVQFAQYQQEQKATYETKINKIKNALMDEHAKALARVESEQEIQVKIEKVIEYVEKVVIKDECTVLANDVVSLLKQTTSIVGAKEPD